MRHPQGMELLGESEQQQQLSYEMRATWKVNGYTKGCVWINMVWRAIDLWKHLKWKRLALYILVYIHCSSKHNPNAQNDCTHKPTLRYYDNILANKHQHLPLLLWISDTIRAHLSSFAVKNEFLRTTNPKSLNKKRNMSVLGWNKIILKYRVFSTKY